MEAGLSFGPAVVAGIAVSVIVGVLTDKVAYKPLREAPKISLLITAIGISFFLENLFNVLFGGVPRAFSAPEWLTKVFNISDIYLPATVIIIPIVTVDILTSVLRVLYRTKYGMAIRALAFDIPTVKLMGIDADSIISIVFALGSALAAVGGIFYSISYPSIDPLMGVIVGLKAFAAAVLGGIGSVTGAVLGGFILGFTEIFAVALFPELGGYKDAFAFFFLILVLLFRPTGIMGEDLERSRF
jgi:branched-chain amino acid transport system permease protein